MGGDKQKKSQVLIPETGAAKFWHVDPRALGGQSFSDQPFNPKEFASSNQKRSDFVEAVNRLIGNPESLKSANPNTQERADIYDRMRYPGMLEPATVDHEVAEATGTFQFGDQTFILPTRVSGVALTKEEAIQRFKDTGEHLGVFENEKKARFYEDSYLTPNNFSF